MTTNGKPARSYTALKKVKNYDIELENFKVLNEYVCVNKNPFKYLDDLLGQVKRNGKECVVTSPISHIFESTHDKAIAGK